MNLSLAFAAVLVWQAGKDDNQTIESGQIIATAQEFWAQMVVKSKGNGTPYFRET